VNDHLDLTFNYLHPARTTPQQPQNLLRVTNKGISDCGCSGNVASSYGLGGLGMYTLLNNGVARVLTRPLAGLGQDESSTGNDTRFVYRGWWIYSLVAVVAGGASAYHGYKRNDSLGWAIVWYIMGAWFPFFTLPIAIAQGYAKRARGTSGFNGRMHGALSRARRKRRK
jgi:hypothetical protein